MIRPIEVTVDSLCIRIAAYFMESGVASRGTLADCTPRDCGFESRRRFNATSGLNSNQLKAKIPQSFGESGVT